MKSTNHRTPRYVVFSSLILTSYFLGPHISSAPYSQTISICVWPLGWETELHTITNAQAKIIVIYIWICPYLDMKKEDIDFELNDNVHWT